MIGLYGFILSLPYIISLYQEIHSKTILHRDLKPENIFVGKLHTYLSSFTIILCYALFLFSFFRTKIGDVGLATHPTPEETANNLQGTSSYLPPESFLHGTISFPVDLWAVGCILYELCFLTHPFYTPGISGHAFLERVLNCNPSYADGCIATNSLSFHFHTTHIH